MNACAGHADDELGPQDFRGVPGRGVAPQVAQLAIRWRDLAVIYGTALLAAVVVCCVGSVALTQRPYLEGFLAGWMVALSSAFAGLLLKLAGLSGGPSRFFAIAIGANAVRALILLVIMVAVWNSGMAHSLPFVVATLAGYLMCLAGEILLIHRASLALWRSE